MKNVVNNTCSDTKLIEITPEMERRMRLIANLIIDRLLEDKNNGVLKLKSDTNKQHGKDNKHFIKEGSVT